MMTAEDTYSELIENSVVLYKLGLTDREYSDLETVFEWLDCAAKVDEAYKKVGITFVSKFSKWNKYYYRGKEISCSEAQRIARRMAKKSIAVMPAGLAVC